MRKIVALVQSMTSEQDREFINYMKKKGWGYWHWIDGAWLITPHESDTDVTVDIRDKLNDIAPAKNIMVFEVDTIKSWAGFGPNTEKRNMFKWIQEEWQR